MALSPSILTLLTLSVSLSRLHGPWGTDVVLFGLRDNLLTGDDNGAVLGLSSTEHVSGEKKQTGIHVHEW